MIKLIKLFVFISLIAFSGVVIAFNVFEEVSFKPYLGSEFHYRHIDIPELWGGNVFPKKHKKAHFMLGTRLNEYLGVELGYYATGTEHKSVRLGQGATILGEHIREVPHHYLSKSYHDAFQFGLMFYYPLVEVMDNPLEAVGYLGTSRVRISYQNILMKANGVPQDINTSILNFNASKYVLKVGGGVQYNYCHSGIRLMLNYENTGQFNNVVSSRRDKTYKLKLKDTISLGAGVVLYVL